MKRQGRKKNQKVKSELTELKAAYQAQKGQLKAIKTLLDTMKNEMLPYKEN